MAELLEFPNAAVWLIRYLDANLDIPVVGDGWFRAWFPGSFVR